MSESKTSRRVLRSIAAVLAGMLAIIILSIGTDGAMHAFGVYPPWGQRMADPLFLLATAYRVVYTIAGNYIAARLAPDRPMRHALAVGFVGLILGIVGAAVMWKKMSELGPLWYSIAIIAMAMPCAWAGGRLREMQLRPPRAGG